MKMLKTVLHQSRIWLGGGVLLLCAQSAQAMGYCWSSTEHNYNIGNLLDNPNNNKPGTRLHWVHEWNSGNYTGTCECTTNERTYRYYKAETPLPAGVVNGRQFYVLNEYLQVGVSLWQGFGQFFNYYTLPWTDATDAQWRSCKETTTFASGSRGYVSFYVTKSVPNTLVIPSTAIARVYTSQQPGRYDLSRALYTVTLNGTLVVPTSCSINAGQILNVPLGEIDVNRIKNKGDAGNEVEISAKLTCTDPKVGNTVKLTFNAAPAAGDASLVNTTNPNLGIRVRDNTGALVAPNNGRVPVIMDSQGKAGSAPMKLAPVNTTGKEPSTGTYSGTATLGIEIQ